MTEPIYYKIGPRKTGYMGCDRESIEIALMDTGIFLSDEGLRKANPRWKPGESYVFHVSEEISGEKRKALVDELGKYGCDLEFHKTFR
jgi:hypothetical protein